MSFKSEIINNHILKIGNWNPTKDFPEEEFSYIDLSSVDKDSKSIDLDKVQTFLGKNGPSRAKQKVKRGDVLISTVRPNLNGVALLNDDLKRSTASTGYCILRTKESLDSKYLFYWTQTKVFIKDMVRKATGANYPAVSDKTVKESKIPLPPLPEQKKIAQVLDAADAYRQKTKALLGKYEELAQAVFLEMFGDPVVNPKGWEMKKLKTISTKIHSGNTPKGGSNVYVNEGITFFRSQNVWKKKIIYNDVAFIDQATHNSMLKSSLKHKDILMTKTGRINTENSSLGRASIYLGKDDKANVNGHVYLIRLKEDIVHEFVLHILTTKEYRGHIRRVCVGGIDKRQLNKNHLEDFPIIFPPTEMQRAFVERIASIEKQKQQAESSLRKAEALFQRLLQDAFRGEITPNP